MKKKRLIPIFLLKDGYLVQSRNFSNFENIGDPFVSVSRFSQWMVDELIYLNIKLDNNQKQNQLQIDNSILSFLFYFLVFLSLY